MSLSETSPRAALQPGAPVQAARTDFNRFELKYLVSVERARGFARDLAPWAEPDPHSGERGYRVHSVYWDSADLTFFWEKLDGQKLRRKLRFRRYERGAGAFVEIKQRLDRTVQKRRVLWPFEQIRAVFGSGWIDPLREEGVQDGVAREALFLCRVHRLRPTLAVAYRRLAFAALRERDVRVTIDSRLQYDPRALDPEQVFETGKCLIPPDRAVVEIKYTTRVPTWLVRLVERHGLEAVRLSKYCAAVDREFFQGRHSWELEG